MKTLQYNLLTFDGEIRNTIELSFDFEKSTFTVDNKTYKIERNSEFVFKVLKTKIKAIDGIEGFYKFVDGCNSVKSAYNCTFFNALKRMGGLE